MVNIFIQRKQHDAQAERLFSPLVPYVVSFAIFYLCMLVLLFLNVLPTGYASFTAMQPALLFAAVFYWSIFYPTILPFWAVFILGMCFDLIVGLPAGGTAFLLLGAQWLMRTQQRFLLGQPFFTLWLAFGLICYAFLFAQWAVFSLFTWNMTPLLPVVLNCLLTILLFPFIVVAFHKLRNLLFVLQKRQQDAGTA